MKKEYPYIRPGKFITNFEVVLKNGTVIPCYNLATARTLYNQYVKQYEAKGDHGQAYLG